MTGVFWTCVEGTLKTCNVHDEEFIHKKNTKKHHSHKWWIIKYILYALKNKFKIYKVIWEKFILDFIKNCDWISVNLYLLN